MQANKIRNICALLFVAQILLINSAKAQNSAVLPEITYNVDIAVSGIKITSAKDDKSRLSLIELFVRAHESVEQMIVRVSSNTDGEVTVNGFQTDVKATNVRSNNGGQVELAFIMRGRGISNDKYQESSDIDIGYGAETAQKIVIDPISCATKSTTVAIEFAIREDSCLAVAELRGDDTVGTTAVVKIAIKIDSANLSFKNSGISTNVSRRELREYIMKRFSKTDLYEICFDLEIDPETIKYENKSEFVMGLIKHFEQRERLDELIRHCRLARQQSIQPKSTVVPLTLLPPCERKEINVTLAKQTVIPTTHTRGDRDFKGHGPEVSLSVWLRLSSELRSIDMKADMRASETKPDHSTAEVKGSWGAVWSAPQGWRVIGIRSKSLSLLAGSSAFLVFERMHTFNERGSKKLPVLVGYGLSSVEIFGDRFGNDIGEYTRAVIEFEELTVDLLQTGSCS